MRSVANIFANTAGVKMATAHVRGDESLYVVSARFVKLGYGGIEQRLC